MKVTYHIRMENPAAHFFQIEMQVDNCDEQTFALSMPVWTPGSYLIREYSKNVDSIRATSSTGKSLIVRKLAKNKWTVENNGAGFILHYNLYAFEESVRTCLLDDDHASIAPAGMFVLPDEFDGPFDIFFYPPANWSEISTALASGSGNKWARVAQNKDELIDSPIEIGSHSIHHFKAGGIEHELAIYGEGNFSIEKLLSDLPKIVEEEVKIFGHHPCDKYLFILLNSNSQRGGLEHLFSTSLIFKRFNYEPESNYAEFLALAAHEYFHLWNVKRLRPRALGPFDYENENYTTSLWIAEGFTSYYDDLIIRRCGLISERAYLDIVEKNLNDGLNPPGDAILSVADASMDTWIKYYRQNENSPNSQTNYYIKGGLIAMMLDMKILINSNGDHSLDDVMREAYDTFYLKLNRGYTEDEFRTIIGKYAGEDLTSFYSDFIFGTKKLDFTTVFEQFGLLLTDTNKNSVETDLGIIINDKNIITNVRRKSCGEKGGLNVNDEMIAVNNFRYGTDVLQAQTRNKKPGDKLNVTVSRNGMLRTFEITLQITDKANYKLSSINNPGEMQNALYAKWIKA